MRQRRPTFWGITLKAIVAHTVTYFAVGLLAFTVFDYTTRFADPTLGLLMRQTDEPLVAAGPLFQPIRGLLFGIVFYLLREVLFRRRDGWLVMWVMLVFVGIFSTFGPAPGSIEGLIYTTLPIRGQLAGLSEVLLQSLLLSVVTFAWVRSSGQRWLDWVMGILFFVVMLLPALGLILGQVAPQAQTSPPPGGSLQHLSTGAVPSTLSLRSVHSLEERRVVLSQGRPQVAEHARRVGMD